MPQISPLSWIFIPFFFFFVYFVLLIGVWWKIKLSFCLKFLNSSLMKKVKKEYVWFW